jgi:hypothetical protein
MKQLSYIIKNNEIQWYNVIIWKDINYISN